MAAHYLPPVPSVAEYRAALQAMYANDIITDNQVEMLRAHYRSPDYTITATELAQSVGYKSWRGANLQYGKLGSRLRDVLNYQEDGQESYVLASFIPPGAEGNSDWLFVMHPEVAQALEGLGWI